MAITINMYHSKLLLLWIFLLCACHSDKTTTPQPDIVVGIVPLNDNLDSLSKSISNDIKKFYSVSVVILPKTSLPNFAYSPNRNRYRADSLLKHLSSIKPDSIDFIIGITNQDIAASVKSHSDWGVFGLGYCPGEANVISTFRLKKDHQSIKIPTRLKNVALHELGHNFGLPHCGDTSCLMKDAKGKLSSVEGLNRTLCKRCKSIIDMP